jgi:hypothetical protein
LELKNFFYNLTGIFGLLQKEILRSEQFGALRTRLEDYSNEDFFELKTE